MLDSKNKIMDIEAYKNLFEEIVSGTRQQPPYDDASYVNYVKLNHARMHRWEKKGVLTDELVDIIKSIKSKRNWILITEPWCGDAANSVPMIEKMARLNSNINLEIQLRDSGSEIDAYLTNGGKAIPKLIVRNNEGEDLFVWGPRPKEAQQLVMEQKDSELTKEQKYTNILQWYMKDKAVSIQKEIGAGLT